jgi:hypothetical protein
MRVLILALALGAAAHGTEIRGLGGEVWAYAEAAPDWQAIVTDHDSLTTTARVQINEGGFLYILTHVMGASHPWMDYAHARLWMTVAGETTAGGVYLSDDDHNNYCPIGDTSVSGDTPANEVNWDLIGHCRTQELPPGHYDVTVTAEADARSRRWGISSGAAWQVYAFNGDEVVPQAASRMAMAHAPEPATYAMFAVGSALLTALRKYRRIQT